MDYQIQKFRRIERKFEKGVKGVLPLRCLPLWGREGVTIIFSREYDRINPGVPLFLFFSLFIPKIPQVLLPRPVPIQQRGIDMPLASA